MQTSIVAVKLGELRPDISLIFPAYNEAGSISQTIAETVASFEGWGYGYEIIVAADGDDGTCEKVAEISRRNPAIRVIGESVRRGKGRGVREGVALATGEIIGYADADNKVPISEFAKIRPWLDAGCEVVIGSRALDASRIERPQPLYRRIGSKGFALFLHAAVGLPEIADSQCGFKFFTHAAARELFARQRIDGYMFDVEILVLAKQLGYRIQQVPIRWRDDGDSRLDLVRGNVRNVMDIFRIRAARMRPGKRP
ncbi:MAG TPA: dolichyl-phosphate beta-glucosyltransferase [Bryobacteraceae bacterium]|nr:dolichyl-phosphate beta-glucosyltransferase [Bryobacteraceae bacterium]